MPRHLEFTTAILTFQLSIFELTYDTGTATANSRSFEVVDSPFIRSYQSEGLILKCGAPLDFGTSRTQC